MKHFWILSLVVVSMGLASCGGCACCKKKSEAAANVTVAE